jgi:hypothetical protein
MTIDNKLMERERAWANFDEQRDMGDSAYDDITGRHTKQLVTCVKIASCTCNCKDTWHAGIQKICADHRQMEVSCIASWHLSEGQELWFPNEAS